MLASTVRRMSTVVPSQIKTLSQLYQEGKLSSAEREAKFKPNDEINSKVSLWCAKSLHYYISHFKS